MLKTKKLAQALTILGASCALPFIADAQSSFTINTTIADAFLAAGSPANPVGANLTGLNFGGTGTLAIAPPSSTKGEFDSVIQFSSTAAVAQFNSTYGPGNWEITGLTLMLASSFPTQGQQPNNKLFNTINAGNFNITLLSDNSWVEGGGGGTGTAGYPANSAVSFNSIPTLLSGTTDALGTFTYTPPGTGNTGYLDYTLPLNADLLTDATGGADISLYFSASAGSQVSYLFNSKEFGSNPPELTLDVTATPEPGTLFAHALAWRPGRGPAAEKQDMNLGRVFAAALASLGFVSAAEAQVTFTNTTVADAFLATGSPANPAGTDLTDLNFGDAGNMVVAPVASVKGEFQTVLRFDVSGAPALFNGTYGTNHWSVAGFTLQLTSNFGAQGSQPNNPIFPAVNAGQFVIEWLSNDTWIEGTGTPNLPTMDGVTYDSLTTTNLLSGATEILCTNSYIPPGTNVPSIYTLPLDTNLVAAVNAGGQISLLLYAGDNQIGYNFNSHEYARGNQPFLGVTANPVVKILSGYFTNAAFQLTGSGPTNSPYQVQASTNLATTNWQTIGTVNSDVNGFIQFNDTNAASQGQRFYRFSF